MAKTKPTKLSISSKICQVSECDIAVSCAGYCEKHYNRVRRHGSPDIVLVEKMTEAGFWGKVEKHKGGFCWEWKGHIDKTTGYGVVQFNGKKWRAHRLAWSFVNGREPQKFILHSCDNPWCVNPYHLREGTPAENSLDMRSRNRQDKKLDWDRVNQIRSLLKDGVGVREIGRRFGVGHRAILDIRDGKSWCELPKPYIPPQQGGSAEK